MAKRTRTYEAFISYSHEADNAFAAELQRMLNRIARPPYKWWQWWPPRIFRDQTNLAAAPDLGEEIRGALLASDSLVLLASPQAAGSRWVDREAATWCGQKPRGRIFIALTRGTLAWDDALEDFDPARTNALPPALAGAFDAEPLWVDFTAVATQPGHRRNPSFVDGAATIAAAIRGTDKDTIIGDDARQHRRTRQLVAGTISLLTLLLIAATLAAVYALIQRNHANERARVATSRQLAAEAVVALGTDPQRSLVLAARAATTAPTNEAADALRQALRSSRLRRTISFGGPVLDDAVDPTGRLAAAVLVDGSIHVSDLRSGMPTRTFRIRDRPAEIVQFSHRGGRLLGAGRAGVVVWSTEEPSRPPLAIFDKAGQPLAAAFSPNGKLVATGDFDGAVRLWQTDTGALVDTFRPAGEQPVRGVSFSGDGSVLAAAVGPDAAVLTLRTRRRRLIRGKNDLTAVATSPDGAHVATGDVAGLARVWNLRAGGSVELSGHSGAITSLAFSPDGTSLVTASEDESARIWDVGSGSQVAELLGHGDIVESASFTPDGKTVVTAGDDGTIRVWATASDPIVAELAGRDHEPLRDVAFDPSGKQIVAASEDLTAPVWSLENGRLLRALPQAHQPDQWVESARFSDDGRLVVTAGDDGTAKVWRASSGGLLQTLGRPGGLPLYDAAFSPDGRLVATAGQAVGDQPAVRLWRWHDRTLLMSWSGIGERADGVAFAPDDAWLAAAGGGRVRVWRIDNGDPVTVLRARGRLASVAFDPSGTRIAAGSSTGAASVWDLRRHERVALLTGHSDTVAGVAFSADGRFLATAGHDGLAKVWTVPGGALVTTFHPRAAQLDGVAFATSGRRVAVAGSGGRVTVFDCAECRPLSALVCLAAGRVSPELRAHAGDAFRRCD